MRNTSLHEPTEHELSLRTKRIHTRVTETYHNKDLYHPLVQEKMFHLTEEERLQQPPFQLIKWLETVDRMNTAIMGDMDNHNLYQYYHPTRPPDISTHP